MPSELPTPHYSFSQLNTFVRCPMHYYCRYVLGLKIPPSGVLTLGSSVHAGIEYNYKQKVTTKRDLKVAKVLDYFADSFDLGAKETEWEKDEKPGEFKDMGIGLLSLYQEQAAPAIQPLEVEQRIDLRIADRDFVQRLDLYDSKYWIQDHKTIGATPSEIDVEKKIQLASYVIGALTQKKKVAGTRINYLIKNKTPKLLSMDWHPNQKQINYFSEWARRVIAAIEAAIDNPDLFYCNHQNYQCKSGKCGYTKYCRPNL